MYFKNNLYLHILTTYAWIRMNISLDNTFFNANSLKPLNVSDILKICLKEELLIVERGTLYH